MTSSSASYDWIPELKPGVKTLDTIPLTGASPPFPWDMLASRLAQTFEREKIVISPGEIAWKTKDHLLEGLGDKPFALTFTIPTLKGKVTWITPEQEMASLEALLLTKDTHPISFNDRALSEGFYRFLAIETLYTLGQINFDKTLVPILTNNTDLPVEDSLCWDISITISNQTLWGRLIISPELRESWVKYFSKAGKTSALTNEMAKNVDVLVDLEVGQVKLNYDEFSSLKVGDWVALDTFTLDSEFNGNVMLTVNGKKAFNGQLENGNIKILEIPSYHEV